MSDHLRTTYSSLSSDKSSGKLRFTAWSAMVDFWAKRHQLLRSTSSNCEGIPSAKLVCFDKNLMFCQHLGSEKPLFYIKHGGEGQAGHGPWFHEEHHQKPSGQVDLFSGLLSHIQTDQDFSGRADSAGRVALTRVYQHSWAGGWCCPQRR